MILNSLKWVFSTVILRRICSFLLFLYIVRNFERADLGAFKEFASLIMFISVLAVFSFNYLIVVEKSKKYLAHGLQFILISAITLSLCLFFLRNYIADYYNAPQLATYLKYGFWIAIPLALKTLIRSLYVLDMKFKLLSIDETVNTVFYCTLTMALFMIDLRFHYYVIAFYLGSIVELTILIYPIRKELWKDILSCLQFKYISRLKVLLKEKIHFLGFTTAPTTLNHISAEAPIMVLGLFFQPENIGKYFIASQFVTVPVSFLTLSLNQVLLPALSLTDKDELASKVSSYLQHIVYITWLPIIVFGVILKYWAHILIGRTGDITIITAIMMAMIFKTLISLITNPLSNIPTILRKPQYEFYWSLCSISTICLILYLFKNIDFVNIIYLYIGISCCSFICFMIIICKMIRLQIIHFVKTIIKGTLYNLPVILVLLFSNPANTTQGMLLCAFTTILSALIIYKAKHNLIKDFAKRYKK